MQKDILDKIENLNNKFNILDKRVRELEKILNFNNIEKTEIKDEYSTTQSIEKYFNSYDDWKHLLDNIVSDDCAETSTSIEGMLKDPATKLSLAVCAYKQLKEWLEGETQGITSAAKENIYDEALKDLYEVHKYLYENSDLNTYPGAYFQYEKLKEPKEHEVLLFKRLFDEKAGINALDLNDINSDHEPTSSKELDKEITKEINCHSDEMESVAHTLWEKMKSAIASYNFELWKSCLFSLIERDCSDADGSEDILMCTLEAWRLFEGKAAGLSSGYSLIVLRELFDLNYLMLKTPGYELDEKRKLYTRFFNVDYDGIQFKHLETTERLDRFIIENRTVFGSLSVAKDIFNSDDFSSWLGVIQEHYFGPLDKIYRKGLFNGIKDCFYFDVVIETFHISEGLLKDGFSEEMKKDLFGLHKNLFKISHMAECPIAHEVRSQYFKYTSKKGIELLDCELELED